MKLVLGVEQTGKLKYKLLKRTCNSIDHDRSSQV